MEIPPVDWQEKKALRKKKETNLNRLRSYQSQWRKKHENWERRKLERTLEIQNSSTTSSRQICGGVEEEEAEALSNVGHLPRVPSKLHPDSKASSRIATPRLSFDPDEPEGSTPRSQVSPLSQSSPSISDFCGSDDPQTDPCRMDDSKCTPPSHRSSASVSPIGAPFNAERRASEERRASRAIIEEEEENNARKPPTVTRSRTKTLKLEREPTIESWEQWRTEFPLEVLNTVAEFYEACELDPHGRRRINLSLLQEVVTSVFGLPPEVAGCICKEGQLRNLLPVGSLSDSVEMRMPSLTNLLALIQGSIERIEELDARLLWAQEDVNQMRSIFNQHVHLNDTMPMAQLFQAIDEVGLAQLECKSAESQKWLIGVIRKIFSRPKRVESSMKNAITFDDFIRIVTAASKAKSREPRHAEFKAEQHARREAGFLPSEMEDLRELHGTYVSMQEDGKSSTLAQILHLFQACQVRDLEKQEVVQLRHIIDSYASSHDEDAKAPFPIFMMWMKEIFELQIGGLTLDTHNSGPCAAPPPIEKKGFAFAMLREQAREEGNFFPLIAHESPMSSNPSRRTSSSISTPERRKSMYSLTERRKSMYSLAASSKQDNRKAFKKSATTYSSPPSMTPRESGSMSQESSRQRSGSRSRESRANSRSNSRSNSARNSCVDDDRREKAENSAIFQLKGLPPQEAMLSRKHFRSTSVDLSNGVGEVRGPFPLSSEVGKDGLSKSELPVDNIALPKSVAKTTLASRTRKQAVETELVVSGALAKLEALGEDSPNPELDSMNE